MTDTSPEAVERLAARLVAEEGHYQKVFDLVVLYRDRNTGGPFADLNNVKHALSGRDPVLLEAADMLRALAAKLAEAEAERDRARRANLDLQRKRDAAEAALATAREALDRLGSGHAFTRPFVLDNSAASRELSARMAFARATISKTSP